MTRSFPGQEENLTLPRAPVILFVGLWSGSKSGG